MNLAVLEIRDLCGIHLQWEVRRADELKAVFFARIKSIGHHKKRKIIRRKLEVYWYLRRVNTVDHFADGIAVDDSRVLSEIHSDVAHFCWSLLQNKWNGAFSGQNSGWDHNIFGIFGPGREIDTSSRIGKSPFAGDRTNMFFRRDDFCNDQRLFREDGEPIVHLILWLIRCRDQNIVSICWDSRIEGDFSSSDEMSSFD